MSEIVIGTNNYDEIVKNNKLVLIDFWATWCGPCQMLGPAIEQIAEKYDGKVVVGKCDVDEDAALAERFNINTIPAVFIIEDGKVVDEFIGFRQKVQIEALLDKYAK